MRDDNGHHRLLFEYFAETNVRPSPEAEILRVAAENAFRYRQACRRLPAGGKIWETFGGYHDETWDMTYKLTIPRTANRLRLPKIANHVITLTLYGQPVGHILPAVDIVRPPCLVVDGLVNDPEQLVEVQSIVDRIVIDSALHHSHAMPIMRAS